MCILKWTCAGTLAKIILVSEDLCSDVLLPCEIWVKENYLVHGDAGFEGVQCVYPFAKGTFLSLCSLEARDLIFCHGMVMNTDERNEDSGMDNFHLKSHDTKGLEGSRTRTLLITLSGWPFPCTGE